MNGKHILCVWEMGGNLGHITCLSVLAKELYSKGYRVSVVLRDLKNYQNLFDGVDVQVFQGPSWGPPLKDDITITCFSDILYWRGYHDVSSLKMMVIAWQHLYQLLDPDLVIFNYSPTALVAAQSFTFKKIIVGVGFGILCPGKPDKELYRENEVIGSIEIRENRVVENINSISGDCSLPVLNYIGDFYTVDKIFITNLPELDWYSEFHAEAIYCRPLQIAKKRTFTGWTDKSPIRAFAYLKSDFKGLEALFQIAKEARTSIFTVINDIEEEQKKRFEAMGVVVSDAHINLETILYNCDFVIASGGNTVIQSVLAGKPVLMVPVHQEQYLMANLVVNQELGLSVNWQDSKAVLLEKISALGNNEIYTMSARAIRDKYARELHSSSEVLIMKECDQLLSEDSVSA